MVESWTELVIGIIIIISPWILGFSDISLAKWCNVLVGLLLVLIGAWAIFGDPSRRMPIAESIQKRKRKSKINSVEQK